MTDTDRLWEDSALAVADLLDCDRAADLLRRTLAPDAVLGRVTPRYLRYKPATNLVVRYEVELGGVTTTAMAMVAATANLAKRAVKADNVELADALRTYVADGVDAALSFDAEVGALVQWWPVDIDVPALGQALASLAGAPAEQLAYKPRRRAVIAARDLVLKVYGSQSAHDRALDGLSVAASALGAATPPIASRPRLPLVTAQARVTGVRPPDAMSVSREVAAIVARLHAAGATAAHVPTLLPAEQMESAAATARLVAHLQPRVRPDVERLVGELSADIPAVAEVVTCHGDLARDQTLDTSAGLVLLDLDRIARAPAELDAATFASFEVNGPADLTLARELFAQLCPRASRDTARWWLATAVLKRAAQSFRQWEPDWRERAAQMVKAASCAAK